MAVTSRAFGPSLLSLYAAEINFTGATVKAMLCTSAYSPNQDTHRYKSSVTNEVTGTGYTAGGVTLTGKTATYDAATNTLTLDAADPSWSTVTVTFRYLVFYIDLAGNAGASPLISYVDFGEDVVVSGVDFTYQLPTGGLLQHTAAA